MPTLSYIVKNILFLGPVVAGPILADLVKREDTPDGNETLLWIILSYAFVFALFLAFVLYKQVNTRAKRLKVIANFNLLRDEGEGLGGEGKEPNIFKRIIYNSGKYFVLLPGTFLDFFLFPKSNFMLYMLVLVFFMGASLNFVRTSGEKNKYYIEKVPGSNPRRYQINSSDKYGWWVFGIIVGYVGLIWWILRNKISNTADTAAGATKAKDAATAAGNAAYDYAKDAPGAVGKAWGATKSFFKRDAGAMGTAGAGGDSD